IVAILLTLGNAGVAWGLVLQQLSLVVAALLAGALALIATRHLAVAGALLALATIKPQIVLPFILWLAVWVAGAPRRRAALAAGFGATMALLWGGSEWLAPGWPWRLLVVLQLY